jgi:hypothetical protein
MASFMPAWPYQHTALYIYINDANQMYGAVSRNAKNLFGFFISGLVAMRPFVAVAAAPDLATHGFFIAFSHR